MGKNDALVKVVLNSGKIMVMLIKILNLYRKYFKINKQSEEK